MAVATLRASHLTSAASSAPQGQSGTATHLALPPMAPMAVATLLASYWTSTASSALLIRSTAAAAAAAV
eukprot:CAMPEP_0181389004 /NCGR_PEP_ID=MMETSP1106-20121128/24644_1 /TAXON_ID=81844 /ORGANISM="Mantoniella antarctica, Strain SL-175" /LENGTH=68 /DNA_ID=CAMNT_0023509667 /DNA_START=29 /DNA_END=231 /DNA_ORIENTATION=+